MESGASYKLTFCIGGEAFPIAAFQGESLLEAAERAGVFIDAPCSGNGSCGKCRVKLLEGEVQSPPSRHIGAGQHSEGFRLACMSRAFSDTKIELPVTAQWLQSRMRITDLRGGRENVVFSAFRHVLSEAGCVGDSGLSAMEVCLQAPEIDDAAADWERLLSALGGNGAGARISLPALRKLPAALRAGGFRVCCVLQSGAGGVSIVDVLQPSTSGPALAGLALDIGTTSVSALLVDLTTGDPISSGSAANRQIRYGADVINRIIASTRPGGAERLHKAIWDETLLPLIRGLCANAGLSPDSIYRAAFAANTTMTHLMLGVCAEHIRLEPYVPAFFRCEGLRGADLPAVFNAEAEILLAPCIGSYVGGDITAGAFASGIFKRETFSLFIDLGTNGELVVGNSDFLMSCACSAGPAFEGGDISCGMRAVDGAIESFDIDAETFEPSYSVIGGVKPAGVCGSGLIDLIAALFRSGALDAKGKLAREHDRVRADDSGMKRFVVAEPSQAETGAEISITEADVDNFIRAKGSIFSAIRTLLLIVGLEADVIEDVYIAGGIGSGINVENAVSIGMLPSLPPESFHYIGNSSLMGAYAMLTSRAAAEHVNKVSGAMTYVELSSHPAYMDEFIAACFLPHTDASLFAS